MLLGILAVAGNVFAWRFIIRLQNRDVRSGLIPPRGSFSDLGSGRIPHLQDYWTNGFWGDAAALSAVDWAVFSALSRGGASWWMLFAPLFGAGCAAVFFKLATREERARRGMDWWFVPYFHNLTYTGNVMVTAAGRAHLVYFASQSGLGVLGAVLLASGGLKADELVVGGIGALLFAAALILDKVQGHFE